MSERVKNAINALRGKSITQNPQVQGLRRFQEALQKYSKKHKKSLSGTGPSKTWGFVDGKLAVLPVTAPIFYVDRLIKEAEKHLVPDTPANRRWAYDKEVSIRAMTKLIVQTLCGAGWEFEGDEEAVKFIESFWESKFNYEEFLDISITNLVRDGNQVWKLMFLKNGDKTTIEGLFPLPWNHLTVYRHPFFPWRTFILGGQGKEIHIPSAYASQLEQKKKFTKKDWEKLSAQQVETLFKAKTPLRKPLRYNENEVVYLALDTKGTEIGQSPLSSVLTLVCYKKLLEYIACRCSELWSSPILELTTGLPKFPPESPEDIAELANRVNDGANMLEKYREFGTFSLPFDQKLGVHFPSRGVPDFTTLLNYLGTEIVLAILGSKALFEARGVELATSKTIKSVWDEALDGWRRLFERVTNNQIIRRVLLNEAKLKNKKCEIVLKSRVWTEEEIQAKLRAMVGEKPKEKLKTGKEESD